MRLLNLGSDEKEEPDFEFPFEYHPQGYLIPYLGINKWDGHIFVTGATGAGKSFLINQILDNDAKKRKIWLFSDVVGDESYNMAMYQFDGDDEAVTEIPDNLRDSICVFDDYPKIKLRDFLLEKGRHTNTMVICVNHKIRDWKWSRKPLNESKWVVLFPSANAASSVEEIMKHGLDRKTAKKIIDLSLHDGRYLMIHQHAPNAFVTQRSIIKNTDL